MERGGRKRKGREEGIWEGRREGAREKEGRGREGRNGGKKYKGTEEIGKVSEEYDVTLPSPLTLIPCFLLKGYWKLLEIIFTLPEGYWKLLKIIITLTRGILETTQDTHYPY